MGERATYKDAYGQLAVIQDERRGRFPYRLMVYTPNGCSAHNSIYATYRAARMALNGLGYCWVQTDRNRAFARL